MEDLDNWSFSGDKISKTFEFKDFKQAFAFMTSCAMEAEKMGHHPDWFNSYNKVTVNLTTHSEKHVTQKDLELAKKFDQEFKVYEPQQVSA